MPKAPDVGGLRAGIWEEMPLLHQLSGGEAIDMEYTISSGIHTLSFGRALTGKAYHEILRAALIAGMPVEAQDDYFSDSSTHTLLGLQKRGIVIYLSRPKRTVYMLKLRIEPERLLGNTDAQALWQCEKGEWKRLVKSIDVLLQPLYIPSLADMKLSIMELTVNLSFSEQRYVDEYLGILKNGCVNAHYRRLYFDKCSGKAKNAAEANRHSYKVTCKQKSLFVYDKTAQLLMTERIAKVPDHRTLRIEVSLRREAIKKEFGKGCTVKEYLEKGSKNARKIVREFLKRLLLSEGQYYPYDEAIELVQQFKTEKTRQRAALLIQLCSRKKSLNQAIRAMRTEHGVKRSPVERVIRKMEKIGLSPLTIPIRRHAQPLPSLLSLLE